MLTARTPDCVGDHASLQETHMPKTDKPETKSLAMLATLSTFLQISGPEVELESFKTYQLL
jgi:hypothetical protein